jgi:hypothetical protein
MRLRFRSHPIVPCIRLPRRAPWARLDSAVKSDRPGRSRPQQRTANRLEPARDFHVRIARPQGPDTLLRHRPQPASACAKVQDITAIRTFGNANSAHTARPVAALVISAEMACHDRSASDDDRSVIILLLARTEFPPGLSLYLASANDRSSDKCFSNCIDFSQMLARESLRCSCCRTIPARPIEVTVVTRRAALRVADISAPGSRRAAVSCRWARRTGIKTIRRGAQTRSRRRVRFG